MSFLAVIAQLLERVQSLKHCGQNIWTATQDGKDYSVGQLYCCYEIESMRKNKENNTGQVFTGH